MIRALIIRVRGILVARITQSLFVACQYLVFKYADVDIFPRLNLSTVSTLDRILVVGVPNFLSDSIWIAHITLDKRLNNKYPVV